MRRLVPALLLLTSAAPVLAFQTYGTGHYTDRFGTCYQEGVWIVDSSAPFPSVEFPGTFQCSGGAADGPAVGQVWVATPTECVLWDVEQRVELESRGTGGPAHRDVAFSPDSNTLFATDASQLYSVPASGPTVTIGSFGGMTIHAIAWDPTTAALLGVSFDDGVLYSIDPATAQLTAAGQTGLATTGTVYGDVYVDAASGDIYLSLYGSLYSVERATGAETVIRDYGVPLHGLGGIPAPSTAVRARGWGSVKGAYRAP